MPCRGVLTQLLQLAGIEATIRQDPARLRPSDMTILQGDNTKLRQLTGWQPTIALEQTLTDLLAYWRQRVERTRQVRSETFPTAHGAASAR